MHGLERGTNDAEQRLTSDVKQTTDVRPPKEIGNNESDINTAPKELGEEKSFISPPKELSNFDTAIHTHHDSESKLTENANIIETDQSIEYLPCRNESLAGDVHPITGVPFVKKIVENNGKHVEVVVPVFESKKDVILPEQLLKSTDKEQFDYCNKQLKNAIEETPQLCKQFDKEQIQQIREGDTPDGYVWHHNEETGKMQLVDFETHQRTGHTGGKSIWGGGSDYR